MAAAPLSQREKVYLHMKFSQYVDKNLMDKVKYLQFLYESIDQNLFLGVLLTKDDETFIVGQDRYDNFGLRTLTETIDVEEGSLGNLTKINALCSLKLRQFSAGDNHILALSEYGVVYSMGHNDLGQLGNDSTIQISVPITVAGDLTDQVVRQIECISGSSVVLTEDGKIYTWGDNSHGQTGQGTVSGSTLSPKVVKGLLTDQVIVHLSTNWMSVFCLTDDGKIYGFGCNADGTLGVGSDNNYHSPVLVRVPDDHRIQDMSSGWGHTIALTNVGTLFIWGYNGCGQLGDGSTTSLAFPTEIKLSGASEDTSDRKVTRIMAEGSKSFAMDDEGSVYCWGQIDREKVLRPKKYEIDFPELYNKPLPIPSPKSLISDLLNYFDNPATSDFVISVEDKDIHVHKLILHMRSPYFENMFNGIWRETDTGKVSIRDHSYNVYYEFLRYLYCGELRSPLNGLTPEECIQLLELATMTMDEQLVKLCAKRIRRHVTTETLLKVFSMALVLDEKDLIDFCVRWTLDGKCFGKVVESEAYKEISSEHAREFMLKCSLRGAFNTL